MFAPKEYSGSLMELAQGRRGEYVDLQFLNERRCAIKYELPLAEVRASPFALLPFCPPPPFANELSAWGALRR